MRRAYMFAGHCMAGIAVIDLVLVFSVPTDSPGLGVLAILGGLAAGAALRFWSVARDM